MSSMWDAPSAPKWDAARINADAIEPAVLDALGNFCREPEGHLPAGDDL
jgi:hypothetical protein